MAGACCVDKALLWEVVDDSRMFQSGNRSLFSMFQVPNNKVEPIFWILSRSVFAESRRKEAGKHVVKRVVIETRAVAG